MRIRAGPCFSSFINHRHLSTAILIIPRMDGGGEWEGETKGTKKAETRCGRDLCMFDWGETEGIDIGKQGIGMEGGRLGKR